MPVVAVISDTHLAAPTDEFRSFFDARLAQADMLWHCGDMVGAPFHAYLQAVHPDVLAVRGNCDDGTLSTELPVTRTVHVAGLRVGLVHGFGLGPRQVVPQAVAELFPDAGLACFGHTHEPFFEKIGGIWLLNPGALSGPRRSFAYLHLDEGQEPRAEHVRI